MKTFHDWYNEDSGTGYSTRGEYLKGPVDELRAAYEAGQASMREVISSSDERIYHGWISGPSDSAEVLKCYGVTLGERDESSDSWDDCYLPESALKLMEKHWGLWHWGLE